MALDRYYFIGIGGVGMSGLARILLEKGKKVGGSDLKSSAPTLLLEKMGALIRYAQRGENIQKGDTIIYSSAIKENHVELARARSLGNPCFHRSVLLEKFLLDQLPLVVAGAHGKTTTTAMLAHILTEAKMDPSFAIGGFPTSGSPNAHAGAGKYFVVESDESDGSFLRTHPHGAILTNIDYDHLDYWKSKDNLLKGYEEFIESVDNRHLFFFHDEDKIMQSIHCEGNTFGFSPKADIRGFDLKTNGKGWLFSLECFGKTYSDFSLPMIGKHNVLNALGTIGLAYKIGVEMGEIRAALETFSGVKRRLEYKGEVEGAHIYDDYAHHPEEIRASLSALKEAFPLRKIVAVFQPHRYSRLESHLSEFVSILPLADRLVVTDVYGAGEERIEGVTSHLLLDQLKGKMEIEYGAKEELLPLLDPYFREDYLLVTLGAGDITEIANLCVNLTKK